MDLSYSPEDRAFRDEVRSFLAAHLPVELSDKMRAGQDLDKAQYDQWHSILNEQGWLAPNWPR